MTKGEIRENTTMVINAQYIFISYGLDNQYMSSAHNQFLIFLNVTLCNSINLFCIIFHQVPSPKYISLRKIPLKNSIYFGRLVHS